MKQLLLACLLILSSITSYSQSKILNSESSIHSEIQRNGNISLPVQFGSDKNQGFETKGIQKEDLNFLNSFTINCAPNVNVTTPSCSTFVNVPAPTPSVASVFGNALNFSNSVNNFARAARPVAGDFTIEFWMKTVQTGPSGFQWYHGIGLVDAEVGGVTNDFGTSLHGSKVCFGVGNPDVTIFSTSNVNTGNWIHVAATRQKATGQMILYINGIQEAITTAGTQDLTVPSYIVMGSLQTLVNGYYNGNLDEVRIWNTVRTQSEISSNMFNTVPNNSLGLVARYSFDQGTPGGNNTSISTVFNNQGNSAYNAGMFNFVKNGNSSNFIFGKDAVVFTNNFNNSNNASGTYPLGNTTVIWTATNGDGQTATCNQVVTVVDNVAPKAIAKNLTLQLDANGSANIGINDVNNGSYDNCSLASLTLSKTSFSCDDINNKPNYALDFDGVDDRVVSFSSTAYPQGSSARTVEMWIKTTQVGIAAMHSYGNFAFNQRSALYLAWGRLYFVGESNDTWGGTQLINDGNWHHVAYTLNGQNIKFYIDGQLSHSTTLGVIPNTSGSAWAFSNTSSVNFTREPFLGLMDEVRVWSSERTATEIHNYYNAPLVGNETNLVAYYTFNEGTGNVVNDITTNNNDGSLTNMIASTDWVAGAPALNDANRVALTATDVSGNTSVVYSMITIKDNSAPTVITKNPVVYLDGNGTAVISTSDVNNGSFDNCGIESISVTPTTFDCNDISSGTDGVLKSSLSADNAFELYISTDNNTAGTQLTTGNNFGVKYTNQTNLIQGQDYWIHVKGIDLGLIEMFIGDFTLTGSFKFDNGTQTLGTNTTNWKVSRTGFGQNERIPLYAGYQGTHPWYSSGYLYGAYHIWDSVWNTNGNDTVYFSTKITATSTSNLVTLTANDASGNVSSSTARVIVKDNLPPTVLTKNATLALDANGQVVLNTNDVNNGSSDNCGIETLTVSPNLFNCNSVSAGSDGVLSSNLTADNAFEFYISTDNNTTGTHLITGNNFGVKYSNQTNLIEGQDYWLHIKGIDLGLIEMIIGDFSLTGSFKFDNGAQTLGTNTSNWKVSRTGFGQNERIPLYAGYQGTHPWYSSGYLYGAYHIWDSVWNTNGNDTVYFSTKITSTVIPNLVTLTAKDASGNVSSNTAKVLVKDMLPPTVVTQNITLQLDANGLVSITPNDVNNGSSDNCGIHSMSVSPNSFNCSNVGNNTVTLSITDVNGNIANATAIVTIQDIIPPTALAMNIVVNLDANGIASITANDVNNGSFDNCGIDIITVLPNTFNCLNLGDNVVTLKVQDISGNISTTNAIVTVKDATFPTAIVMNIVAQLDANGTATITANNINNGSFDNCAIQSMTVNPNSFNCTNVGSNQVIFTITDNSGNTSTATAFVNVQDNIYPTVITQDIIVNLDASGSAQISANDVNNGSYDNCGIASMWVTPNTFSCPGAGNEEIQTLENPNNFYSVTLGVTDVNGNTSYATAFVTVQDITPPTVITQNITVNLDENGFAAITVPDVNNGSFDNCGIETSLVSPSTFNCSNLGNNIVTLNAIDNSGNGAIAQAIVTVQDIIPPTAVAQFLTLDLNENGFVQISANDVNNGSFDNCGIASMAVVPNIFDCSNIGSNNVIFTVKDNSGNTTSIPAIVFINDNTLPTVLVKDAVITLDASGMAYLTPQHVDNGSFDNCTITNMLVVPSEFDCSMQGLTVPVQLTITDIAGNKSIGDAFVTILDNIFPTAICKNIEVALNANGLATISVNDIDNGSFDNCGIVSSLIDKTDFNCTNVGANDVIFTITDAAGNTSSCSSIVTVIDNIAPTAICKNAVINLNSNGTATLNVNNINDNSFDNCGIVSYVLSKDNFDCTNIGLNNVTLTIQDNYGNSSFCNAQVTVSDNINPIAIAKNITVYLNNYGYASITANDIDNGSYDNCSITNMSINVSEFDCADICSTNTVILTVNDGLGNSSSATSNVTVKDNIAPSISVTVSPSILKHANNKMEKINATVIVNDNCGKSKVKVMLKSITSSDGDDRKHPDIQDASYGKEDYRFSLRAERSKTKQDRVYTIVYVAIDGSGNRSEATAYVTVPYRKDRDDDDDDHDDDRDDDCDFIVGGTTLNVYPNPTVGDVNIIFNSELQGNIQVRLMNLTGKELLNFGEASISSYDNMIDMSEYPAGVYLLEVKFNSETKIVKIVKY